ncbi:MAG: hypothetical protein OEV01_06460 [Nitrospira sp.]|jgi:hypothetical protein|nr:hypothetical protein [Nitrospira sp.]MDH4304102.1 hypothetical protein [Nitrospira sp.]
MLSQSGIYDLGGIFYKNGRWREDSAAQLSISVTRVSLAGEMVVVRSKADGSALTIMVNGESRLI